MRIHNLVLTATLTTAGALAAIAGGAPPTPTPTPTPAPAPSPAERLDVLADTPVLAGALQSRSYLYLNGDIELASGVLLRLTPDPGPVLPGPDMLPVGVYVVLEEAEAFDADGVIDFTVGETIGVLLDPPAPGAVSVTCATGWFACCYCWTNDPDMPTRAVARCRRPKETDYDCVGGGHGAVSCSIDKATCVEN